MSQAAVESPPPHTHPLRILTLASLHSVTSLPAQPLEESCLFSPLTWIDCACVEQLLYKAAQSRYKNVNLFKLFMIMPGKRLSSHLEAGSLKVRQPSLP